MPEGRTVKADIVLSEKDIAHVHACEPLDMRRLGDRPVDIDETIDGGDAARDHIRPGRFGPGLGDQRLARVSRVEEHPYEAYSDRGRICPSPPPRLRPCRSAPVHDPAPSGRERTSVG